MKIRFKIGLMFISAILCGTSSANELVTGNDFAPYSGEKLPDGGFATDIVVNIVKNMGTTMPVRFLPWKRGYEQTVSGAYLATFPYVKTMERENEALFSEPLYYSVVQVWSLKENLLRYSDHNSLIGKTFCNPLGYFTNNTMKNLITEKKINLQEPPNMETCLKFLALGRADFVIGPKPAIMAEGVKAGVSDKLAASEVPYQENPNYLIVGKNNKDGAAFLEKFNESLKALRGSEKFSELIKKHNLEGAVR